MDIIIISASPQGSVHTSIWVNKGEQALANGQLNRDSRETGKPRE